MAESDAKDPFTTLDDEKRAILSEILPSTDGRGRLLLGGIAACSDISILQKAGVTHILSCALQLKPAVFDLEGAFSCLHLKIEDDISCDIRPFFKSGVEFITTALLDPESCVFVHCHQGKSRSASLILAYLLNHPVEGAENLAQAYKMLKEKRNNVYPNAGFMLALMELEENLKDSISMKKFKPCVPAMVFETKIARNEDILKLWVKYEDRIKLWGPRRRKPKVAI